MTTTANANTRAAALKLVQMYGFILAEAALFLDTYPDNQKALEYWKRYKKLEAEARADFVERFGMLSHTDLSLDATSWEWVKGPWPWEVD